MSVNPTVARLAEQQMLAAHTLNRTAAQHLPPSPCCNAPLLGSAARSCTDCGATVPAWAISHEVTLPAHPSPETTRDHTTRPASAAAPVLQAPLQQGLLPEGLHLTSAGGAR